MRPPEAEPPDWLVRGARNIWLPYTQMKLADLPVAVARTRGSRIELCDGRELVDGVASWWTACHGYNHPTIAAAVRQQLERMPHVMFGGLAHEQAYRLASRLAAMTLGQLSRVFFTDSGSVAVEVAIKMAVQYRLNRGERKKRKILCFRGAYHGDTIGTMAVCDPEEGMHAQFSGLLPEHLVADLPRDEESSSALRAIVERHADELTAIIVEPLAQGAGGMLFHEADTLQRLRALADEFDLLLIFDEIFTGFARTGSMFAMSGSGVTPDILTLSKALTGGTSPLAATIAHSRVFDAFWSDEPEHALMHGPTFMGNALGCAAANASLDLFESEPRLAQARAISASLVQRLARCRDIAGVRDVRVLGAIGVVEFDRPVDQRRLCREFVARGVWIRPFGRIIYLTPALTITEDELCTLTDAVWEVLLNCYGTA